MPQRFRCQPLRAIAEVKSLQRDPAVIAQTVQRLKYRAEIVIARAAMAAVELVHVDVTDVREVALNQRGMRIAFVDGVVDVEHGLNGRTIDLFDYLDRFL